MNITNISRSIFVPFGGNYKSYQVIYDNITFTDSYGEISTEEIDDELTFNYYFFVLPYPFKDELVFTSYFDVAQQTKKLSNRLTFVDSYPLHDIFFLSDRLTFVDSIPLHDIFFFFPRITFTQSFTKQVIRTRGFSNTLHFTDSFAAYKFLFTESFTNVIDFIESYICSLVTITPFSSQINFVDSFLLSNSTFHLALQDKLDFSEESFNSTFDNNIIPTRVWTVNKVCRYYTDSKQTYANKFIYLSSFTRSIQLDSPNFGDLEANVNEVIINRTVGGARYTHVKKSKRKHLKYEFTLRCDKYQELLDFIDSATLEWINLTNWKNETWTVRIINDPVIVKASSRDIHTITIEFEGYKTNVGFYNCLE